MITSTGSESTCVPLVIFRSSQWRQHAVTAAGGGHPPAACDADRSCRRATLRAGSIATRACWRCRCSAATPSASAAAAPRCSEADVDSSPRKRPGCVGIERTVTHLGGRTRECASLLKENDWNLQSNHHFTGIAIKLECLWSLIYGDWWNKSNQWTNLQKFKDTSTSLLQ